MSRGAAFLRRAEHWFAFLTDRRVRRGSIVARVPLFSSDACGSTASFLDRFRQDRLGQANELGDRTHFTLELFAQRGTAQTNDSGFLLHTVEPYRNAADRAG